jgi:hypothetical protein
MPTSMLKSNPKDWLEDKSWYQCRCAYCKELFVGYKRRIVCKECDAKPKTCPWDNWQANKEFV